MSYTLPEVGAAIVSQAPFRISFSRIGNTTDIWLNNNDGLPANESPIVIPFNAKIIAISATTEEVHGICIQKV